MWTLFFAAWVQMKDDLIILIKIRTLRLVFYQHATKFMICCLSVSILGQAYFAKNSLCSTLRVKFNNYTLSQRSQLFRFLLLGQGTRYRGGGFRQFFHFNPDCLNRKWNIWLADHCSTGWNHTFDYLERLLGRKGTQLDPDHPEADVSLQEIWLEDVYSEFAYKYIIWHLYDLICVYILLCLINVFTNALYSLPKVEVLLMFNRWLTYRSEVRSASITKLRLFFHHGVNP